MCQFDPKWAHLRHQVQIKRVLPTELITVHLILLMRPFLHIKILCRQSLFTNTLYKQLCKRKAEFNLNCEGNSQPGCWPHTFYPRIQMKNRKNEVILQTSQRQSFILKPFSKTLITDTRCSAHKK